ncbi:hypothetical protein SAMN05216389_101177 [Oceanobacillus limi]|uniref:Uncharacterized protein n=1 Tax=Oceanobacillus limi TaxID=930131 RepID=A0A1H9Y3Z2_9BACI|nr:hypothetical protein [Oceanobacillus limi]SES63539.1 hypothetical protein SAMN05216389_101177 [Oceanobacillus limi]
MTKKRVTFLAIIAILIVTFYLVYLFYFSKPTNFPTDEQLVEKINEVYPQARVETILDSFTLDQEHVYVPFKSHDNEYGTSYWVWEKHKWKPMYIDSVGEPRFWKIDPKDPSRSYIIWNVHPDDQVTGANFYLIRDRNYHISYDVNEYIPRVQMEEYVDFEEKSYGVLELPDDWRSFLSQSTNVSAAQNSEMPFLSISDVHTSIGWMPLDDNQEMTFPENSVNGHGFINGEIVLDFVLTMEEFDLEK